MRSIQRLKQQWHALRSAPPGERFERAYHRHQEADRGKPLALRLLRPLFALLSFAVGVVLVFIPGPAVLFFAISAALLASLSLRLARYLDRFEVWVRHVWAAIKTKFRRRPERHAH